MLITIYREEVIKPNSLRQKICELYFEEKFNCVCIAKELGISPQYVSKVLKGHPKYEMEKKIRSEERYKKYLERKKKNRQLRAENLKGEHELEYLKHLQFQHSIEMSKRYLV